MNITISGATGLIGQRLVEALAGEGHAVNALSRGAETRFPSNVRVFQWEPAGGEPPAESLRGADAVFHLAGEPLAQRWTAQSKQRIRESRVAGTRNLVRALERLERRPGVLVCASGVGYYGSRGDEILVESSAPGSDFVAEVCVAWEQEAQAAEALGVRVLRMRTGVALAKRGGALAKMLPPFRLGLGGKLAGGRNWMSWIHLEDLVNLFLFALHNPMRGAVNAAAPNPARNEDFTRALARALHRPAVFPVPALALRILFGEMAEVVLASQRVSPQAAEAAGFRFGFPELGGALEDVLKRSDGGK